MYILIDSSVSDIVTKEVSITLHYITLHFSHILVALHYAATQKN